MEGWKIGRRGDGKEGRREVVVLGFTKILGLLAVSVSGRGYPVDGAFLMCRSTQPTDYRSSKTPDESGNYSSVPMDCRVGNNDRCSRKMRVSPIGEVSITSQFVLLRQGLSRRPRARIRILRNRHDRSRRPPPSKRFPRSRLSEELRPRHEMRRCLCKAQP